MNRILDDLKAGKIDEWRGETKRNYAVGVYFGREEKDEETNEWVTINEWHIEYDLDNDFSPEFVLSSKHKHEILDRLHELDLKDSEGE